MKKLFILPLLIFVIIGCDQGQQMMKPVLKPEPTIQPPTLKEPLTDPSAEVAVYPKVTFENVLDLIPGEKYRLRPLSISGQGHGLDAIITDLVFGSLTNVGPVALRPDLPADTLKVVAWFTLTPAPYETTPDSEPVFGIFDWQGSAGEPDEIIIEIKEKTELVERTSPGGRGRDPSTYNIVRYEAVAIENLTHPDRTFEYE